MCDCILTRGQSLLGYVEYKVAPQGQGPLCKSLHKEKKKIYLNQKYGEEFQALN